MLGKLLYSKIELNHWTVTEMHWKRKLGSWLSPETDVIFCPSSEKNTIDEYDSFKGRRVSSTIGWNIIVSIIIIIITISRNECT